MKVYFYTPSLISYIDLISIGGSEKEGDEKTIGQFHTGLKNAISLFMRNNVGITFNTYSERGTTKFVPEVFTKFDEETEKSKELIGFRKNGTEFIESTVSPKLGFDWELFMGLREIYANMLDEDGWYSLESQNLEYGTEIILEFDEGSEFETIWKDRGRYIREDEPLYKLDGLDILDNPEGFLRIYKQGLLVYEDLGRFSKFSYNIHFGDLDDRRKLRDFTNEVTRIIRTIATTTDINFIQEVVSSERGYLQDDVLSSSSSYIYDVSDAFKQYVEEVYELHGEVFTYPKILGYIRDQKNCKISGRKVRTLDDAIWNTSEVATVEMSTQEIKSAPRELTLVDEIHSKYEIEVSCDVIRGSMKGSKCIADKQNNLIILSDDFNLEQDFHKFVIQYIDLTEEGNIVDNLAKNIVELIKK